VTNLQRPYENLPIELVVGRKRVDMEGFLDSLESKKALLLEECATPLLDPDITNTLRGQIKELRELIRSLSKHR